ncbi:hypothetical protein LOD99_7704 [Oopsacas minuta]|uniref:Uncharacterized protein n=1 Tax=Oopsacas minuta TaxID=111878 RepID=A0AAV7JPB7_9METZ|nr:hypothetical protein LOD99_7704 [Oopsacas minuta]
MATVTSDTDILHLSYGKTIILLIDTQQAFTVGSWRQHVVPPDGVNAIIQAFQRCSLLLRDTPPSSLLIFSLCPFLLSNDFSLDPQVTRYITKEHKLVLKPGNCILDADGFESHIDYLLQAHPEVDSILIGGCTLTSCIRVSSCSVYNKYSDRLRVIVSMELCGARDDNYKKRCLSCMRKYIDRIYTKNCVECVKEGGDKMSPVEKAIADMRQVGSAEGKEWELDYSTKKQPVIVVGKNGRQDILKKPWGIAVTEDHVFVSDISLHALFQFSDFKLARTATIGSGEGELRCPRGLCTDYNGDVYLADCSNKRVCIYSGELKFVNCLGAQQLRFPVDVKVTPHSHFFSRSGHLINSYISKGIVCNPWYFCLDRSGNILISDYTDHDIKIFSPSGELIHTIGRIEHETEDNFVLCGIWYFSIRYYILL